MNHQTQKPKLESSNYALPFCYAFSGISCTVALCVVGGFSILEANMKEPRIFSPAEFTINPESKQDFSKIYEQGESEVCLYV